jgi:hypothetical protein
MEEQPPTKKEPSAEAEHAPEPRRVEPAPIVAIAGVYFRRPVWKKDGSLVWQKFRGHPSQGAELISLTRSAIAGCDGDPIEVLQKAISDLPEAVLAKCQKADADPVEIAWLAGCWISRTVERHLPPPDGTDQGLRSEMIARRMDCLDRHPDVEHVQGNTWRGRSHADLDRFARDMEAVDRANGDLLYQREWREVPKNVVLAILRGLGYRKPENLYRDDREPWTIPTARPK